MTKNKFLLRNRENPEYNQYWYSSNTIDEIVSEIEEHADGLVAFLSTPSLFFSYKNRHQSYLFEIDKKWEKEQNFVYYDFNKPNEIPNELHGKFSYVIVDPPFITREVWSLYAITIKLLIKKDAKILASTIAENEDLMRELLQLQPVAFKPSIPHLVYQYNFFCNYTSHRLSKQNPEILV